MRLKHQSANTYRYIMFTYSWSTFFAPPCRIQQILILRLKKLSHDLQLRKNKDRLEMHHRHGSPVDIQHVYKVTISHC